MPVFTLSRSAAALPLLLTGCAVYVPTMPSTPLLDTGQVEVRAGLRSFTTFEVGAAWSPRPHLLLGLETGWQESSGSSGNPPQVISYRDFHRQQSVSVGYYRSSALQAPSRWYWAVAAGAGSAHTHLHAIASDPTPVFGGVTNYGEYQAQYWRGYVQAYGAWSLNSQTLAGVSLRGTAVSYQYLLHDGQAAAPAARGFAEPTLFVHFGRDVIQGQASFGLSLPLGSEPFQSLPSGITAPTSSLLGASVILRPDLLFRRRR